MKILIADDEYDLLSTLQAILEDDGHEVFACGNGAAALEQLQQHTPDLVLLDVMMPRRSGLDVLREMRRRPEFEHTPVILMSAIQPKVDRAEYRWDAFIRKPFTFDRLQETLYAHGGLPRKG